MSNGQEPEEYHPTCGMRVTAAAEEAVRRVLLSKRPLVMVFNNVRIKVGLDTSAVAICAEYHAAEEARRAPTEPVCPEGIKVASWYPDSKTVYWHIGMETPRGANFLTMVYPNGDIEILDPVGLTPDLLEYTAAVSRYRGAALGQQARALEKVRAAKEAYQRAEVAYERARKALDEARRDMAATRREAGLA